VSRLFLLPVTLYRTLMSPLLAPRCRYYPTCSSYAVEAIRRFGVMRGLVLAGWRLLRCNPLSDGGFDPVEQQTLFRAREGVAGARR
jgi:putative membrane protein insertion efficiency factor